MSHEAGKLWVRLHTRKSNTPAFLAFPCHKLDWMAMKGLNVVTALEDFGLTEARALLPQGWSLFNRAFERLDRLETQYELLELAGTSRYRMWMSARTLSGQSEACSGFFTFDELNQAARQWSFQRHDIFELGQQSLDEAEKRLCMSLKTELASA